MAAKIKQYRNVEETQNALARELSIVIEQSKNNRTLLFLSGGSCFTLLPLVQDYLERIPTDRFQLTIGMVDERFDKQESNFVHLKTEYAEFYHFMEQHGATFIDTSPRLKDQYEMAEWYEKEIVRRETSDLRRIILLGMGPDGHIAGILPFPNDEQQFNKLFVNTKHLVVGYDATGKNQFTKRFTLTYPALYQADKVFVFITEEEKKTALEKALTQDIPLNNCPAHYFQITKQEIEIFTPLVSIG